MNTFSKMVLAWTMVVSLAGLAMPAARAGAEKLNIAPAIEKCRAASWFRINGVGVASTSEIKVKQALQLCEKAEKLAPKNAKVWAYLSRIYAAAKNYDKSLQYAQKSADAGSAEGMTYMGALYHMGWGVKKDVKEATKWYRKAVDGGSAPAMRNLGGFYKKGSGVKKDLRQTVRLYNKSALQGDLLAQIEMGHLFYAGSGVRKDYDKAVFWYAKADKQGLSFASYYLGLVLDYRRHSGDLKRALGSFERAKEYFIKRFGKDHVNVASMINSRGLIYKALGHDDIAIKLYSQALPIFIKKYGKNHDAIATIFNNMGRAHHGLAQYDEALKAYSHYLAIEKKIEGKISSGVATAFLNIGTVYFSLGRYDDALKIFEKSLAIYKKKYGKKHDSVADVFINKGAVYSRIHRPNDALKEFLHGLKIYEEKYGKDYYDIDFILMNVGNAYKDLKQYDKALVYYQRSMKLAAKAYGASHVRVATILNNIGVLYNEDNNHKEALTVLIKSFVIASEIQYLDLLKRVYHNLSFSFYLQKNKPAAISFAKLAVNTQQQIRAQNRGLKKKLSNSFAENWSSTYQLLSKLLIEQGRLGEAEQVMAMLKQQEFFTFLRGAKADSSASQIALNKQEREIQEKFNKAMANPIAFGRELQNLFDKRRKGEKLSKAEQASMEELTQKQNKAMTDMVKKVQTIFADLLKNPAHMQTAVQAGLGQGSVLRAALKRFKEPVAFYQSVVMGDKVHLLVFTGAGAVARRTVIDKAKLSKKIAAFREAISSQGAVKQKAKELYDLLIKPVEADLKASGAKTVLLSLDGVLRYLPYAALYDGKHYLVEKYSLVLDTPMARPFWQDKAADWNLADGFGMSKGADNFSALPNVESELAGIVVGADGKGILQGKTYLNEAFTQASLINGLRSKSPVLHVATHFQFKAGYPAGSHLLLGDGSHLNLATMARKPASFDFSGKDLVALSACQTALGTSRGAMGAEIDGLGALIVSQGGKSVLATLWSVADKSTSLLMQRFYELRAKEKMGKGLALAVAQREFLKDAFGSLGKGKSIVLALARGGRAGQKLTMPTSTKTSTQLAKDYPGFSHPYYWAPFVLMGHWK